MLTSDDAIRLAREAGFEVGRDAGGEYVAPQYSDSVGTLVRFAALVATDEREECAMVCDAHTVDDVLAGVGIAKSCAAIIRARGEKGGA